MLVRRYGNGLRRMIAGVLIGIACVLPGVSGGVLAISLGLYRPMLDAVLHLFQRPKEKFRFLLPLALGGGAGLMVGARGLSVAMSRYESLMLFLFIGFLLGGIPELWREARADRRFRPRQLLWLLLGVALALPLVLLGIREPIARLTPLQALAAGLLEGVGTVIPGVSTSFVLIRLGWYQAYLNALSALALGNLTLIGLGFAVSALACMRGVQWLFDNAPGPVYTAVLGFLLLSIAMVFPGFDPGRLAWADVALTVIGIVCARWLAALETQKE